MKKLVFAKFINTNEGRNNSIDLIKLFAACLVILGHCMQKFVPDGTYNILKNFIWLLQMPLFMITAGMVNTNPNKVNDISKLLKRFYKNFMTLVLPCFTFMLIKTYLFDNIDLITSLRNFFLNPETNLWFLWVIFLINCIFDISLFLRSKLNRFSSSRYIPIVLSFLVAALIFFLIVFLDVDGRILSIKLMAYYLPYYCFGYLFILLVNSKFYLLRTVQCSIKVILIVCVVVFIFMIAYFPDISKFDDFIPSLLFIRVFGSLAGSLIFIYLISLLSNVRFFGKVSILGKFTLQSYYIHVLFLELFEWNGSNFLQPWLIALIAFLCILLLTISTIVAIYFIPFGHLLIFGKSLSYYNFEKQLFNRRNLQKTH